jgi:hypothetical protein
MPIGSGTVKLTEIINEFGTTNGSPKNLRAYLKCSSISSVDSYSGGQSGTTPAAPSTATHVKIRVWGGGGEGGGAFWSDSAGEVFYGGGGGAGGYVEKVVQVTGGATTFDYVVGTGGNGAGDKGSSSTTDATAGGAGSQSTVTGTGVSIIAGGGSGGLPAGTGTYGDGGAGGSASGGDYNIIGQSGKSGIDGGTGGFSEGAGAPRNRGTPVNGSAPGGGGGGGANGFATPVNLTSTPYDGTNGGAGRIDFIWFTSGVAEHENNVSIPFTGTLNISNFRSSGSNIVSRDFQSDTYTGQFNSYADTVNGIYEKKSGVYTSAATSSLGLVYGVSSGGTKGSIDVIGRSISGQSETASLNSILDFGLSFVIDLIPTNCALVLNGDVRISNWDIPWTVAAVTLNNTTVTLHRANSIVPSGSYSATNNITYWAWYGSVISPNIFGFVNGSTTPYNFTCKVGIL